MRAVPDHRATPLWDALLFHLAAVKPLLTRAGEMLRI